MQNQLCLMAVMEDASRLLLQLSDLTFQVFMVTVVFWGVVGVFFSLSPLLPLYREGRYLVKIKCLSIITLVCVNYSWGS